MEQSPSHHLPRRSLRSQDEGPANHHRGCVMDLLAVVSRMLAQQHEGIIGADPRLAANALAERPTPVAQRASRTLDLVLERRDSAPGLVTYQ